MVRNAMLNAVSFQYLLLDSYARLGLSEDELAVSLMLDHLLEQGNTFITADMLSLKMTFSSSKIDGIMSSLMKKGFLVYETGKDKKMTTSLGPLKERCRQEFSDALTREGYDQDNPKKQEQAQALISLFEEKWSRTLSPIENQYISEWLDSGFSEEEIRNALLDTLTARKKTIKAVDRALVNRRKQSDIELEGASGVSDHWDKSVQETVEAARSLWDKGSK